MSLTYVLANRLTKLFVKTLLNDPTGISGDVTQYFFKRFKGKDADEVHEAIKRFAEQMAVSFQHESNDKQNLEAALTQLAVVLQRAAEENFLIDQRLDQRKILEALLKLNSGFHHKDKAYQLYKQMLSRATVLLINLAPKLTNYEAARDQTVLSNMGLLIEGSTALQADQKNLTDEVKAARAEINRLIQEVGDLKEKFPNVNDSPKPSVDAKAFAAALNQHNLLEVNRLKEKLDLTETVIQNFLISLEEHDVGKDDADYEDKLAEIASRHIWLKEQVQLLNDDNPEIIELKKGIEAALNLADHDLADALLEKARDFELSTATKKLISAANFEYQRAELAIMRFNRAQAFEHFVKAASILPDGEVRQKVIWLVEAGDNAVTAGRLFEASKVFGQANFWLKQTVQENPDSYQAKRDLSVSLERIGDVQVAQGNLEAALENYKKCLAISKPLSDADPTSAYAKRFYSVYYLKIGDVQVAQGQLGEALQAYEKGLVMREELVSSDPGNFGFVIDVGVSLYKVIGVETNASERKTRAQRIKALLKPGKEAGLQHPNLEPLFEFADQILAEN